MVNVRVTPSPVDNELLFLEREHRAYYLFHNKLWQDKVLEVRRSDQRLWSLIKNHPISVRVMNYIQAAGFRGVFDCGYKLLDHSLITALVERWRPETHTFHLLIGEVTVTLQDIQVMWGLRIEGDVVTGKEEKWSFEKAHEKCVQLLGYAPQRNHFRSGRLKVRYLRNLLEMALPNDALDDACIQRARVYILLLLGGVLFPDSSDGYIHLFMLRLIEDLDKCSGLSWGSAVLACLYKNLCKATSPDATEICGPLMLLQLWAWCRLSATSPILPQVEGVDDEKPYGARWNCPLSFASTPSHMLMGFRSLLHALNANEFIWTPYDAVLQLLREMCSSDRRNWMCDTYIIFWEIVEECLPSRVMRQFNLVQTIPTTRFSSVEQHKKLHGSTRRGVTSKDWRSVHEAHINQWNNRRENSINGHFSPAPVTVDGYMGWYWPRTVIFITNPGPSAENSSRFHNLGGNLEMAVDGISRMHQDMGSMMGIDPQSQQYLQGFYNRSRQYLHLTHADDRTHYRSTHVVDTNIAVPNVALDMNRLQRMPTQGGRRGGHSRSQPDDAGTSNQGQQAPSSPVNVRGFDLNIPWGDHETHQEEEDDDDEEEGRLGHYH